MTAHKHAALMAQYAQDAMETDKPFGRWEFRPVGAENWMCCIHGISFSVHCEYRRKPRTLTQKDEQEPVAWCHLSYNDDGSSIPDSLQHCPDSYCTTPLYTAPPKRKPLTDECINEIANSMPGGLAGFMKGWGWQQFARQIEAAHGIGAEHDA